MRGRRAALVALAIAVVVGAVALGLALRDGGDPVLEEMESDPLAATLESGGTLVVASNDEASDGNEIYSKPSTARILRSFRPAGTTPESLAETLATKAESAGWSFDRARGVGRKGFRFGTGELSIQINRYVSPTEVVVTIEPLDA